MTAITGYGRTYLTLGSVDARGPLNGDTSSGEHKYWRLMMFANRGYTWFTLNGLHMFAAGDVATNIADSSSSNTLENIYTTNGTNSNNVDDAFIGSYVGGTTPDWYSNNGENTNIWLAVEFETPKDIRRYKILNGGTESGGDFDAAPTSFALQYSDDNIVWRTRHTGAKSWPANGVEASTNSWTGVDDQFIFDAFTDQGMYGALSVYAATSTGEMPAEIPGDPIVLEPVDLELTNGTLNNLQALTASATIDVPNAGESDLELPALTSTGVMLPITSLSTLEKLTSTGTILKGGSLTQVFPAELENPTSTGFIDQPINYTGSSRLEYLSSTGLMSEFGNDAAELPELTATGTYESGSLITGAVELDQLTALGSLDFASLYPLTATGVSQVGNVLSGSVSLQRLSGTGGTSDPAELLPLTTSATMVSEQLLTGTTTLQQLLLAGEIDNPTAISLSGSSQLKEVSVSGLIVSENLYTVSASLQKLTLAATGSTGKISSASITLPFLTATGAIASDATATATITLPLLTLTAAINAEVAVASGSALVMNLSNKALTTFDAYGYNSFTQFNGLTLAASENGIFALTGDTDAGTAIAASVRLGKLDFDIQQLKTVDYAYVGYRASGDLSLTVRADDGTEYSYTLSTRETERHSSRVRLGKGIRGRYLQFGLDNVAGSDFRLDTLELIERIRHRKIA